MDRAVLGIAALALVACAGLGARRDGPPPLPPPPPPLEEGARAPDVAAMGMKEKPMRLGDFRARVLVVYFYPVDFSSSGTAQAREFKADYDRYRKLGVEIVGVSTDHVSVHKDFAERYKIPFPLLSDEHGALARALGVEVTGGTTRHVTFVLDRDRVIRKVWRNVHAWGHSAEVLGFVRAMRR
jgi:peroxiredoxin Q/BCP